jgi:putative endonuclease
MLGYKKKLGAWGEELAQKYFEDKGYRLIEKNWRANGQKTIGEIDLICCRGQDLVFIEVKTRTNKAFGYAENAVDYFKKKKISKAINSFIFHNEHYRNFFPRFDILVVEIFGLTSRFEHFENVELGVTNY